MFRQYAVAIAVIATLAIATPARADGDAEADTDAAYQRLVARGRPHYLRAALEEVAILLGGAGWYWADRERQVADWDYPSIHERLTFEAWRFDNNPFPINFLWHPINGGAFHLFARTNDIALLPSIGFAFATSLSWEYLLEFREKTSINDVIVTTDAGTAVGEFFHWLGRYLESAPDPRGWNGIARWGLTPQRAAHDLLDGTRTRAGTTPDALGLSSDIWHRFWVSTSVVHAAYAGEPGDGSLVLGEVAAAGELAALPGYLTARSLHRFFADGNLSSLALRASGGDDAVGFEVDADAVLLGLHVQDIPDEGVGSATTVGLDLGYGYRRDLFGDWTERLARTHLPGLALDHHLLAGAASVRVRARLRPDFVGVHATAYRRWKAEHPDAVEKTILSKHGYYYGWGASGRLELEARLPRLTFGGSIEYGRYGSQEGLDKNQEELLDDVPASDRVLDWNAFLRVAPLGGRWYLEGRIRGEDRDGSLGELSSTQSMRQLGFVVGAAL